MDAGKLLGSLSNKHCSTYRVTNSWAVAGKWSNESKSVVWRQGPLLLESSRPFRYFFFTELLIYCRYSLWHWHKRLVIFFRHFFFAIEKRTWASLTCDSTQLHSSVFTERYFGTRDIFGRRSKLARRVNHTICKVDIDKLLDVYQRLFWTSSRMNPLLGLERRIVFFRLSQVSNREKVAIHSFCLALDVWVNFF